MENTLYLICTVCNSPMRINENVERGFIYFKFKTIVCVHCSQENVITEEIRDYVKNTQEKF